MKLSFLRHVFLFTFPFALMLGIWQIIVAAQWFPPLFLPSPGQTVQRFIYLMNNGEIGTNIGISAVRLLKGWLLGTAAAVAVGWLLGLVGPARQAIQPLLFPMRFIEPVAWISIVILWFGTGETSKTVLLAYSAFFGSFLSIMASAASVDSMRIHAAQTMGATRWQVFATVIVPSTVPGILTGARVGMGYSFLTIITAEMLDGKSGLGYIIARGHTYMKLDQMFVGTFLVGCIGLAIDFLFRVIIRRFGRRFFLNGH